MSAHKTIDAVQIELHHPSLDEINPINTEPLLQTLAHGEIPSNYQINDAIDRAKSSIESTKEKAHLNDKGERLVKDAESLLDTAQKIINERNAGDSIQNLLHDSKGAAEGAAHDVSKQLAALGKDIKSALPHIPSKTQLVIGALPTIANGLPGLMSSLPNISSLNLEDLTSLIGSLSSNVEFNFPTDEVKQIGGDAKNAYNLGKEIALYSIRSKEFRDLLGELVDFFHGAFGDLTEKISEVGESVKMDIDKGDVTMSNTRDTAAKDGKKIVEAAKDSHPIEMTDEIRKETYAKLSKLINKISEKPEYKKLLDLYWKYMDEVKEKMDEVAKKAMEKASELKDKAVEKGSELKDKAEELKDKAADKASDLKDMAIEKGAELKEKAKETAVELKDDAATRANKVALKNAGSFDLVWNDVRDIIDNFGGAGTFDAFYTRTYNFYARLYNDKAARRYLHDLRSFMSEAVKDPKSLATQQTTQKGMDLVTQGRKLIQSERYAKMFNGYFAQWRGLLNNFSNDSLINDFTSQLHKFAADFALDSQGRPDIYAIQESLDQIKSFIYPILVKQLENMTVAKIVGNSDSYDWTIENLSVGIANFVPESFDLRTKNHTKVNIKDIEVKESNTRVVLDIHSLKPHFNNVKFWYRRKSFPHIEDTGTVDVDLSAGEGTRVKVIWKIKSKHNRPFAFSLMEVKCVIDKMDVKVKDAQHDILDRIAASVFMAGIKQEVANGIVNAIVDVLHPINDTMNKWFATRPIGHVTDKLNESVHKAFEEGEEKLNKMLKEGHPVDSLVNKAREGIEYVKDQASDSYDMIVEKTGDISSASESLRETASILKRKAEKTLSQENPGLRDAKDAAVLKVGELKDAAMEKGSELLNAAKENMPTDLEDAKKKAGQLKDAAVDKATELKDAAKEKYPEAAKKAEQALEKGAELKDAAMAKGSELASKAKENMPADLEDAKKKAGQLKDAAVDKATELKDAAKEKYPEAAKKAEQALEKGSEMKDAAVAKGSELASKAKENMPADLEDAKKKAGQLKDAAVDKATELKDAAVTKGKELKGKAEDMADDMDVSGYVPSGLPDAAAKAGELKDKVVEKGSELKDKAVEKGSELKDSARGAASYAAVVAKDTKDAAVSKGEEVVDAVKGSADAAKGSAKHKAQKKSKDDKWHSEWKKPSKTTKQAKVHKVTVTETKEIIMEDKIAANPYEALSEDNLKSLQEKKAH